MIEDLKEDEYCRMIPDIDNQTVQSVMDLSQKK